MPTKFLKPKNMRRGLLALLLAAPLVYMFGSLFFALNGAHEGAPLANPIYVNEEVEVSTMVNDGSRYAFVIDNPEVNTLWHGNVTLQFRGEYYLNGILRTNSGGTAPYQYSFLIYHNDSEAYSRIYSYPLTSNAPGRSGNISINGDFILPLPWHFEADYDVLLPMYDFFSNYATLYRIVEVATTDYVDNPASFSDYLFGQFFAKDNWVASLGEKAVNNDTGIGLPFVGDLISYIDGNAMPLSNSSYGYFIWGYSTYILNVLAIYMVVSIAASFVLIPMKVVDSLEERING